MKFGIDMGHNCPPDTGARGIRFEDNLTKDVGTRVRAKLKALGHEVVDCLPSRASSVTESLSRRCAIANANKVDTYVSIHFNAFNGQANGTEVFATSEAGRKIAQPVLDEIIKLGYFKRGIKNGSHLFVLRNTDMPAILIECCFIDAKRDMDLFNAEAIANAIVKGLTGKLPTDNVKPEPDEEQNTDTSFLRVQKALNQLKITDRNGRTLKEDNNNNPETRAAIERFQAIVGLQTTGVAGPTTWSAINQILAKRILRPNHAGGPVVRYLQHRVGVTTDGVYGPNTQAAVIRFQRLNRLAADGIVGFQTWKVLIG
ncbi:MAG: N-acetylmuramoyl-L-alanine amidase [Nostocaceae cyanobacterium]|nr:N-acetylmuramoyl-L-alanine amidase [Nostocaceae cyanobacterium]